MSRLEWWHKKQHILGLSNWNEADKVRKVRKLYHFLSEVSFKSLWLIFIDLEFTLVHYFILIKSYTIISIIVLVCIDINSSHQYLLRKSKGEFSRLFVGDHVVWLSVRQWNYSLTSWSNHEDILCSYCHKELTCFHGDNFVSDLRCLHRYEL